MRSFIKINPKDNVIVALTDIKRNQVLQVDGSSLEVKEDIGRGHKIALKDMETGKDIIKYGFPIGHATNNITGGTLVHSHNMSTNLKGISEYSYSKKNVQLKKKLSDLKFKGYRRENGEVGIRNELWIVPTVGCVNGIADEIIKAFKSSVNPSAADSVQVFKHNYGCSQLGEDHENTVKILGDIVKHPNAGGVLVLGLGCENNTISAFKEKLGSYNKKRVKFLTAQEVSDEISEGVMLLSELYGNMLKDTKEDISIAELKIGLKCGGSDGLSGITANPLLGVFSDFLTAAGGTTILTEVPEMFGAEQILMDRAENEEVFHRIVKLINNFKSYFMEYKQPIYENPSPGNKAGGITTLEEKSLGCTQKCGNAEVIDVLGYGEAVKNKGLNLLNAPGNDLVAATALGASGCHMVLFTTGRGTPFGSFVPTVKISTNSQIYKLKPHWIDFNAGSLVEDIDMKDVLEDFINYILKVAGGEYTNNEKYNIREISIFKNGVTL